MSDKNDDTLAATDDANTVDSNGRATTPLHEAVSAAVEATQPDSSADDGDNDADGGDDVDESSAGDKDAPKSVANIFQRYASTPDARVAAAQFTPKQYGTPGNLHPNQFGERLSGIAPEFNATTDQADNAVRIVGGDSQVLDGNALRVVEAQISEATRANFDTSALQQQAAAIRSNVLNVRAPMPTTVRLDPLAKVPTPR